MDYEMLNKLNDVVDNVAKRPLCVIKKNQKGTFNIINYYTDDVVVRGVPFMKTAERTVRFIHKIKSFNDKKIIILRKMIDDYYKYDTDVQIHEYTLKKIKNKVRCDIVTANLEDSKIKLDNVIYFLMNF